MGEITLHRAESAGEIEAVRTLMREYAQHLASNPSGAAGICLAGFEQELASLPSPYAVLLLASVDGQAAGCVVLKALSHVGETACDIKRLWVRDRFRGLGLGPRLMLAAMDEARRMGCVAVYLDTIPEAMPEAVRLYDMLGFQQVDRYNDNPLSGVRFYRRSLLE